VKRLLALLLAIPFLFVAAADAQTYTRAGQLSQSWTCSLSGLAASLTECQALSAGNRHYITDIVVQTTTGTTGTYSIQSGTGTNCATATAALFPASGTSDRFNAPINSQPTASVNLTTPIVPTVGHAICVIGVATNTIDIQLFGFTVP